jgi:hypothetical protein
VAIIYFFSTRFSVARATQGQWCAFIDVHVSVMSLAGMSDLGHWVGTVRMTSPCWIS